MTIKSKIHSIIFIRPVVFWVFVNFIAACACTPGWQEKKYPPLPKETYHFDIFFTVLFVSTLVIALLFFITLLNKKVMTIEGEKIIYKNYFSKTQQEFSLSNIVDFTWQGGVRVVGTRYGGQARLSNDSFELKFKSGQEIIVKGDQFANFIEIRAFFYNYCIKHHIIEIRPLEERKRSRLHK